MTRLLNSFIQGGRNTMSLHQINQGCDVKSTRQNRATRRKRTESSCGSYGRRCAIPALRMRQLPNSWTGNTRARKRSCSWSRWEIIHRVLTPFKKLIFERGWGTKSGNDISAKDRYIRSMTVWSFSWWGYYSAWQRAKTLRRYRQFCILQTSLDNTILTLISTRHSLLNRMTSFFDWLNNTILSRAGPNSNGLLREQWTDRTDPQVQRGASEAWHSPPALGDPDEGLRPEWIDHNRCSPWTTGGAAGFPRYVRDNSSDESGTHQNEEEFVRASGEGGDGAWSKQRTDSRDCQV